MSDDDETHVKVYRELSRVMAPVGIRCKLCRLWAEDDNDRGAFQLTISFGAPSGESCTLSALTKRVWICPGCAAAIRRRPT